MADSHEFKFRLGAFTPDTIPMKRLAGYLDDLATLFGNAEEVHFARLKAGSTVVVTRVEGKAVPLVRERVFAAHRGEGHPDAQRAYDSLNRRLTQDRTSGALTDAGKKVIDFPGIKQATPIAYPLIPQQGTLDGLLIRVGGMDETIPVHLRDGDVVHHCTADEEVALRLAKYYLQLVRVHGLGKWKRTPDGQWIRERFVIESVEPLDDEPLTVSIARLRQIKGSKWSKIDDPKAELFRLRHGTEPS